MRPAVQFLVDHSSDLRLWLALTVLALGALSWLLFSRAFRRDPPGFVWRTLRDDRGVPDGKLLAVCHALIVMTITMAVGWTTGAWPPAYVWLSWDVIAIAGIFGVVYVTKKYYENGGSTEPAPDFGLTAPAADPATSTTLADAAAEPGEPVLKS